MVIVQETKVYMFVCLRSGDFDDFEDILKILDYSCFQERGWGWGDCGEIQSLFLHFYSSKIIS